MKSSIKLLFVLALASVVSACGSSKKNFSMKVHSDPLGAYALMQVKYKGDENPEWIFLGPTPVIVDKSIKLDGARSVSLKVIRPGFFEQVKTWSIKDFKKEYGRGKKISWVPSLVEQ